MRATRPTGACGPSCRASRIPTSTSAASRGAPTPTSCRGASRSSSTEENAEDVERTLRAAIEAAAAPFAGVRVEIRRLLLARALAPLPGNAPLVDALVRHATAVFGEAPPVCGTPLYTDARLFSERGIPAAIYGAGPRTVLESNAKRADEHLVLEDLRRATQVVARTLFDLLQPA
jgi:acetylornithine deacetylase/succinyl-diaminopimelate desuccinylase-like protein